MLELKEYEISKIGYISPFKICSYLQEQGWLKRKELNGISVWTNTKTDNLSGIFVPLRDDFVDYQSRVFEILYTLQEFEKRPIYQIIQSLHSLSYIAKASRREVIEFRIKYIFEEKYDASLKKIGSVFKSLQDLFEALGEFKSLNRVSSLNMTSLKKELEVSLIETFQGSFGFRLGFSKSDNKQLEIFDVPIAQDTAQEFLELIKTCSSKPEIFEIKISKFSGKSFAKFKSFISNLITLNANIDLEWGSINIEKGGAVSITYEQLIETLELIKKREISDPTVIKITAKLILASVETKKKKHNKFIAVTLEDEQEYRGNISKNILDNKNIELTVGKIYQMSLEETISVNMATGNEETNYTLIDLKEIKKTS